MTDFHIRRYQPSDADALAEVFRRSVLELGPRRYTPLQVSAWAANGPTADTLQAKLGDGRVCLVVEHEEQPVAFADLEADGHIDFFYCDPKAAGTGAASELAAALFAEAEKQGIERLYSEVSETARGFFMRQGFRMLERRDLTVGGVDIHNYSAEKKLTGQP